jgi:hypothetical protein
MKRKLILGVSALILWANPVLAQSVAVELNLVQRTQIKDTVLKQRTAETPLQERLLFGSTVPAGVSLLPAARDWAPTISRYSYLYADGRVLIVDPASRKVVRIVE